MSKMILKTGVAFVGIVGKRAQKSFTFQEKKRKYFWSFKVKPET